MVEPKMYTYSEFCKSTAYVKGMKKIKGEIEKLNVRWLEDIVYIDRGNMKLHLQILVPYRITDETFIPNILPRTQDIWPIVIYIPGSGWRKQNVAASVPMLVKFAQRGFVIALVEYRPSDEAIFPAQVLDVKAAVKFMKKHASEYSSDPNKLVIWGDSTGGHTALIAAFTCKEQLNVEKEYEHDCTVKSVIDYCAPIDISKMNDEPSIFNHVDASSPEGMLIGKKNVLENINLVEPTIVTNYISKAKNIPPVLIFHGDKDRVVPFMQSILLYEALRDAGKDVIFYKLEGADHNGAIFWTHSVLDIVEKFIRRSIDKKYK
jgi:acetyl esterase/lipase